MSSGSPRDVVRVGNLKANIWENEGKHGTFLKTTFAKTYRDQNGNVRDTDGFNESELLLMPELSKQAYDHVQTLKQELKQEQEHDQPVSNEKEQIKQRLQKQREDRVRSQSRER